MAKASDLVVSKFGGSVLTGATAFRDAAAYLGDRNAVSVVSAMQGLTNAFISAYEIANTGSPIQQFSPATAYMEAADTLPPELKQAAAAELAGELKLLKVYAWIGARDAFVGSPEGHSAILLKYHLMAIGTNAMHLAGPDAGFYMNGHGLVDMEKSRKHLRSRVGAGLGSGQRVVVGGYLGIDDHGCIRAGARNINDAFASALADALGASTVEIVKDVPGVYRIPPEFGDYGLLNKLSYNEARKMTWRGSPVVHPSAVRIAQNRNIPVVVKNLGSRGTWISAESQTNPRNPVAALVAEKMQMVCVYDDVMDTPEGRGYMAAIYSFERDKGIDIAVSAADFGGISYTVILGDRKGNMNNGAMLKVHNEELAACLHSCGYNPTIRAEEAGVITIVGDGMQNRPGMLSQITSIPAAQNISIRSAVQSDERHTPPSITLVVDSENLSAAVKALAEGLFA